MSELTEEQAIALYNLEFWKALSYEEIARFQLFTDRLCMPFDVFHKAVEKTLKRSVWTHEFGLGAEQLRDELLGKKPKPTMEDIINLIPEDKRLIILTD